MVTGACVGHAWGMRVIVVVPAVSWIYIASLRKSILILINEVLETVPLVSISITVDQLYNGVRSHNGMCLQGEGARREDLPVIAAVSHGTGTAACAAAANAEGASPQVGARLAHATPTEHVFRDQNVK